MPTVNGFCHVYLPARDLDKAIEFYTQNLGFSVFRRWSAGPGRDAAYCILGGVLLEMTVPQGEAAETTFREEARFGLAVTGLDVLLDQLRAKGVEVLPQGAPPRSFSGRQVRIKDPSGWLVALREWQAPDGPHNMDWQPSTTSPET